jgi:hypothetical protein
VKPEINSADAQLAIDLSKLAHDPVAWMRYAFRWGKGELEKKSPEPWQIKAMEVVRDGLQLAKEERGVIRVSIASGNGIGKSALISWLILWGVSTLPDTRIIVTAGTERQLGTKTWPELAKWHRQFIAQHWFEYTATALYSKLPNHDKNWRADSIPWSKSNPEAFAGMHNQGKRTMILMDEASAIEDVISETISGALTDAETEIIWVQFGNPTRNIGYFHDTFNKYRHRWTNMQIDSRSVSITNKEQINQWIEDYGIDSDFVRVHVRGLFPNASDTQFIPSSLVNAAAGRLLAEHHYTFAPVIIGVDPAIYGDDECVIYMRQGLMSKRLGAYRKVGDDFTIAGYIARMEDEYKADAVFVDMGYGTGIVSAGRQLGRNWTLVPFAGASADEGCLNKRAEIWMSMKNWLKEGGCIEDDPVIREELVGPEYRVKLNGKLKIEDKDEMRSRGCASPNRADALALTFAFPIANKKGGVNKSEFTKHKYNPLHGGGEKKYQPLQVR